MTRVVLTDAHWVTIWTFLVTPPRGYGGRPAACRRFLNAVRWVRRRGAPWRLLPPALGRWNRVFKRFSRWGARGGWTELHQQVVHHPELPAGC